MSLIKDIVGYFNKADAPVTAEVAVEKRFYEAAAGGRLQSDWIASDTSSPDNILKADLKTVRNRARDIVANNPYAAKFLGILRNNIVGADGFILQVKAKDPNGALDAYANELLEEKFWDWSKLENCTVDKSLSFREVQEVVLTALARDGEALVRKVYLNDLKYGFALQLLEPDLLDEDFNMDLGNGYKIRMGVELDPWDRVIAYHFKQVDYRTGVITYTNKHTRIPADQIIHLFRKERPSQHRGISWFAPVLNQMKDLKGYQSAAVVAARAGASQMGFLVSQEGAAKYTGDGTDAYGNIITEIAPGKIERLPDGLDFKSFNPQYPHSQYDMFVKSVLRGIASGLGVSYNTLASDLSDVNYSSIRAGVEEEREAYKIIQAFLVEHLLNEIFRAWLLAGDAKGAFGTLPVKAKVDKFNAPIFSPRRWKYVNPTDDITATVTAIENGLKTKTQALAEQGIDYEEFLEERQQEQLLEQEYGVAAATSVAVPSEENTNNGTN